MAQDLDSLKERYSDPTWREKFIDFCDLVELLGDCIIADSYTVSDSLNSSIALSDLGTEISGKLIRKEKVNAKTAHLMCALAIGHDELLVDIENIDLDRFVAAINEGILDGSIRFPYVFGRELYDAYAELFEEENELLTNRDTLRLLDKLEIGVFQYGRFTVGPYGLRRSLSFRNLLAPRSVPAYHCSKSTCRAVHTVVLQTGQEAPINDERKKIYALLEERGQERVNWIEFASDISGLNESFFGDSRAGVLLPLIGEALSDSELRSLIMKLLDATKGSVRAQVKEYVGGGAADLIVKSLTRGQMLQLVLVAKEDDVFRAVDGLIRSKEINIPNGDIRKAVLRSSNGAGAFQLSAEMSSYGVRYVSSDRGLALLRLKRLLSSLYVRDADSGTDVQELEWQLRGVRIEDLDERLEHFFRDNTPESLMKRMVLSRKTNVILACAEAGIEDFEGLTDDDLVNSILWKLGFAVGKTDDPHQDFWRYQEQLSALAQSSEIGGSEKFRQVAASYFSTLEGILLDSLAFSTWALFTDHTRAAHPFTYDNDEDRTQGLSLLQSAWETHSSPDGPRADYLSEEVTLGSLIDGFLVLAKQLEGVLDEPASREQYKRPEDEFPLFDGKTNLKVYKFRSTLPFLDLSAPSKERILSGLRDISKAMREAAVPEVRNDYSHYRRVLPDIQKVEAALESVRHAVTRIESMGLCRMLFVPGETHSDRWGRTSFAFNSSRSYEHIFTRPTQLDWMGLPFLDEAQYLMRYASFEDPNEILRFTPRYPSEFYQHWENYPKRRLRSGRSTSTGEPHEHKVAVGVSGTA